jgi:hypothetical protein
VPQLWEAPAVRAESTSAACTHSRSNLGLFAVLGELSATANWRAISEEIWPFVRGPAATPMGEAEAAWRARRQAMAA